MGGMVGKGKKGLKVAVFGTIFWLGIRTEELLIILRARQNPFKQEDWSMFHRWLFSDYLVKTSQNLNKFLTDSKILGPKFITKKNIEPQAKKFSLVLTDL